MAVLQGDGFDHYPASLLSSKWDFVGAEITGLSGTYSRFTDDVRLQGCRMRGGFGTTGQASLGKNLPSAQAGVGFHGIAFRMPTMPSSGYWMPFGVYDIAASGGMKLCALVGADGSLNVGYITVNNFSSPFTILKAGNPGQVVADTWYTIEASFKIHSTLGACVVSLNGATAADGDNQYIEYSGNTVRSTGSNYHADSLSERYTHVRIGGNINQPGGGEYVDVDDYYYCDTVDNRTFSSDLRTDTFLSNWRYGLSMPNGVGNVSDLLAIGDTPNWKCVEELVPDDLTSYVAADSVDMEDNYTMEPVSTSVAIYAVLTNVRGSKDDAEARNYATRVRTSGASPASIAVRSAPSTFVNQQDVLEFNPATTKRMTPTQYNASQFGVRTV